MPCLPDVEAIYYLIRTGITDEHVCAHIGRGQDMSGSVGDVGEGYGDLLHITNRG